MANCLGPYQLVRRIAAGGMGEVYLAVLTREGGFEKTVALKTMLPSLADKPDFARQFEAEASMAAKLSHANIVQVFDHGRIDGRSFLSMEFVEGPDLAELIDALGDSAFPPQVAAELGVQLCRGLGHAHERRDLQGRPVGIVHGDVSPHNVLLSPDGQAKITDFGLARLRDGGGEEGAVTGKYSYMSPEQARGQAAEPSSDLFSAGLILFELFTGQRAYPLADPPESTLALIRAGDHPDPAQLNPDLAPGITALLKQALAQEPDQRFESATDMARALTATIDPCGPEELARFVGNHVDQTIQTQRQPEPTEVAGRPVSPPQIDKPRRRWLPGLIGLVVICWGVGFGWWALHTPPKKRPEPPSRTAPLPPAGIQARLVEVPSEPDPPEPDLSEAAETPTDKPQVGPLPKGTRHVHVRPRPVTRIPKPEAPAKTKPSGLVIDLGAGSSYRAVVDHKLASGPRFNLSAAQAHLIRLTPNDAKDPEVLLRFSPPGTEEKRWRLTIRSTPWMRIRLAGRPMGQTPRGGLRLPWGESRLLLKRQGRTLDLGLAAHPHGTNP